MAPTDRDAARLPAEFDPDVLLKEAREATGLSDFGDDDFREGLRVLCETYTGSAFNDRGRRRNRQRLIQLLTTRLKIHAAYRAHPEILAHPVTKPMVLTGMPRSGTSALFNLLAADPEARPLLLWEAAFPDPLDELEPGQSDPRRDMLAKVVEEQRKKNPEFTKIHFSSPDTPEECVLIHAFALHGVHMGVEPMFEPYLSWYREQDLRGLYRYYKGLLQLIDWQRPGTRWLLKAPAHMWGIDPLIETFPDVSIVWSHRDPLLCTASICSMTWALMQRNVEITKEQMGPVVFDFYATSLERGLAARDRNDPDRFVDVHHDDFVADPLGVARGIYDHFGLELDAARDALRAYAEAHPQGAHGRHEYALEEYGLEADRVRERFAPYIERFGLDER